MTHSEPDPTSGVPTSGGPASGGAPAADALTADLNPTQSEAVRTVDGPVLVLAGAGTGKTRVLTTRLAYILRAGLAMHGQILAVTFTNKAAREMKERVGAMTGRPVEGWWLGTFHALAARMLRQNAERIGLNPNFTIIDTDDQLRLMKQLLQAESVDEKKWPARTVLNAVQRWKDRGLTPEQVSADDAGDLAGGRAIELYKQYQQRLLTLNACDFGDLLLHCLTLFREAGDVLEKYQRQFKYILVDEYQDTNVAQYLWLRLLAQGHKNICCVGDDDQCLVAGTPVTLADGRTKPIEEIAVGDGVLSSYGTGDFRAAEVSDVFHRRCNKPLVKITTKHGRTLTSTPEHQHFADFLLTRSPQRFFVYLMHKEGTGYRLGTSQVYTQGQKSAVVGYKQRALQEHADAAWLVESFDSENEARAREVELALTYGIPQLPFVARKGGSTKGLVHDQAAIDRIFARIDTHGNAQRLMSDTGLDPEHPHHRPRSRDSNRRNLVVTLCADRRGPTPMHRISMNGSDADGRDRLENLGLSVRSYRGRAGNWRFETVFRDMGRVEEIKNGVQRAFPDVAVVQKANILGDGLPLTPARHVRPGMVIPAADGRYDEVVGVDTVDAEADVYDLNIAATHNFVADGLVTHNSIYGWRGAEVGNILRFEQDFPGASVIRLEKNYRSTGHVLGAAGGLISHNEGRLGKTLWTEIDRGEPVRVRGLWDGDAEARFVGEEVEALQADGHPLSEIAVLVRTGAMTRGFEDRFFTIGLPYRIVGGARFFERLEIRDALAYLRLIQSPDDDLAFERILNTPKRGLGDKALQTLHQAARARGTSLMRAAFDVAQTEELRPQARRALAALMENFARWRHMAQESDHVSLAQSVLDESGYTEMWQRDKSAEAPGRLDNLKELISAMGEFDTLGGFLEHVSLVMETFADDAAEKVTVMTLHAAKGLEFDTVFLAGWEEGLFPNQRALDENGVKGLEEERRLAYVGLTRARHRAIVSFAANRRMFGSWNAAIPSRFVDELPKEHVKMESDPGLYGTGTGFGSGGFGGGSFGGSGFAEQPSRWTPGMARAYQRRQEGDAPTKFIEGTAEAVESVPGRFTEGDRVFHRKFGYGTVKQAEGERLTIDFDKADRKKVMASFVVPPEQAD
ncbi:hypothetical protein CKO28_15105 [Rhodovibrio sodomensis]|uniref:DNA 3'-5' helicase n=1 Tax=Rhodovibrio sodomensis TaxID=1088 RepID=A0ABS1DJ05_9PROT|nr:UvrD-helicase domain-containing protein [Rhodovibrio sodomensis]MBK1669365.1 hypothetical protein [Rhodovibrio sodomensis]